MAQALTITAIGMGLVFVGLLLLWLMMSVLVRITQAKQDLPVDQLLETHTIEAQSEMDIKPQVAAAAVAAALGVSNASRLTAQAAQKSNLSPWQAAHRQQQTAQMHSRQHRKD